MENTSCTDRARNEEVLRRGREDSNILPTVKRRKVSWNGHILRRNCFIKQVNEGKIERRIEIMRRQRRRRKQLLVDLKNNEG